MSLLINILQTADLAQQTFSSDSGPSLHLALLALEALYMSWTQLAVPEFHMPLQVGINKIAEYYNKASNNGSYCTMCQSSISNYSLIHSLVFLSSVASLYEDGWICPWLVLRFGTGIPWVGFSHTIPINDTGMVFVGYR